MSEQNKKKEAAVTPLQEQRKRGRREVSESPPSADISNKKSKNDGGEEKEEEGDDNVDMEDEYTTVDEDEEEENEILGDDKNFVYNEFGVQRLNKQNTTELQRKRREMIMTREKFLDFVENRGECQNEQSVLIKIENNESTKVAVHKAGKSLIQNVINNNIPTKDIMDIRTNQLKKMLL